MEDLRFAKAFHFPAPHTETLEPILQRVKDCAAEFVRYKEEAHRRAATGQSLHPKEEELKKQLESLSSTGRRTSFKLIHDVLAKATTLISHLLRPSISTTATSSSSASSTSSSPSTLLIDFAASVRVVLLHFRLLKRTVIELTAALESIQNQPDVGLLNRAEAFNNALQSLREQAQSLTPSPRVPWQLEYALLRSESDSSASDFQGGKITDASGNTTNRSICSITGFEIQHWGIDEHVARVHSIDNPDCDHVLYAHQCLTALTVAVVTVISISHLSQVLSTLSTHGNTDTTQTTNDSQVTSQGSAKKEETLCESDSVMLKSELMEYVLNLYQGRLDYVRQKVEILEKAYEYSEGRLREARLEEKKNEANSYLEGEGNGGRDNAEVKEATQSPSVASGVVIPDTFKLRKDLLVKVMFGSLINPTPYLPQDILSSMSCIHQEQHQQQRNHSSFSPSYCYECQTDAWSWEDTSRCMSLRQWLVLGDWVYTVPSIPQQDNSTADCHRSEMSCDTAICEGSCSRSRDDSRMRTWVEEILRKLIYNPTAEHWIRATQGFEEVHESIVASREGEVQGVGKEGVDSYASSCLTKSPSLVRQRIPDPYACTCPKMMKTLSCDSELHIIDSLSLADSSTSRGTSHQNKQIRSEDKTERNDQPGWARSLMKEDGVEVKSILPIPNKKDTSFDIISPSATSPSSTAQITTPTSVNLTCDDTLFTVDNPCLPNSPCLCCLPSSTPPLNPSLPPFPTSPHQGHVAGFVPLSGYTETDDAHVISTLGSTTPSTSTNPQHPTSSHLPYFSLYSSMYTDTTSSLSTSSLSPPTSYYRVIRSIDPSPSPFDPHSFLSLPAYILPHSIHPLLRWCLRIVKRLTSPSIWRIDHIDDLTTESSSPFPSTPSSISPSSPLSPQPSYRVIAVSPQSSPTSHPSPAHWAVEYTLPTFQSFAVTSANRVADALHSALKLYPSRPFIGVISDPPSSSSLSSITPSSSSTLVSSSTLTHIPSLSWITFEQFHFVALRLASALTQIPAEDFPTTSHPLPLPLPSSSLVGICMANRPEWLLADVALLLSQHIVVGIVPDWPINEIAHVLSLATPALIFVDNASLPRIQTSLSTLTDSINTPRPLLVLVERPTREIFSKYGCVTLNQPSQAPAASLSALSIATSPPTMSSCLAISLDNLLSLSPPSLFAKSSNSLPAHPFPSLFNPIDYHSPLPPPDRPIDPRFLALDPRFNSIADTLTQPANRSPLNSSAPRTSPSVSSPSSTHASAHPQSPTSLSSFPSDMVSIIFTSGSSGIPKGVIETQDRFLVYSKTSLPIRPCITLSYASLAHGMDRGMCLTALMNGGRVIFADYRESSSPSPSSSNHQLICYRPAACLHSDYANAVLAARVSGLTLLAGFPRLFDEPMMSARSAVSIGLNRDQVLVSAVIRHWFGPSIRHLSIGGAHVHTSTIEFCRTAFLNATVHDNYGLTEVPGVAQDGIVSSSVDAVLVPFTSNSNNTMNDQNVNDPTLQSSADNGLFSPSSSLVGIQGEIYVRSNHPSPGYYRDPDATAASYINGWFKTGDLGELVETRSIRPSTYSSPSSPLSSSTSFPIPGSVPVSRLRVLGRVGNVTELYISGRSEWVNLDQLESFYSQARMDSASLPGIEETKVNASGYIAVASSPMNDSMTSAMAMTTSFSTPLNDDCHMTSRSPSSMEQPSQTPIASRVILHADRAEGFLIAFIVPTREWQEIVAKRTEHCALFVKASSPSTLSPELLTLAELNSIHTRSNAPPSHRIRSVILLSEDILKERNLLTPLGKVKRFELFRIYQDEIRKSIATVIASTSG